MSDYTITTLIIKLEKILQKHGDLPIYIFDEYDHANGKNTLDCIIILDEEKKSPKRPKRIEFQ